MAYTIEDLRRDANRVRYPVIDTRGVKPEKNTESEEEGHLYDIPKSVIGNALTGFGAIAKGLGAYLRGLTEGDGDKQPTIAGWAKTPINLFGRSTENIADTLNNIGEGIIGDSKTAEKFENMSTGERLTDPDYWTSIRGLGTDLSTAIGQAVPYIAAASASPNKLAVANELLGSAAKLFPKISGGAKTAGEVASRSLPATAAVTPMGLLANAGSIVEPLKTQGKSYAEIGDRMAELMKEELPADLASSLIFGGTVTGSLGKGITKNLPSKWSNSVRTAAGYGATAPIEMANNYLQNLNQAILSNKYSEQPHGTITDPLPSEVQAGYLGLLGGLPTSAVGAYRGIRNADQLPSPQTFEQTPIADIFNERLQTRELGNVSDLVSQRAQEIRRGVEERQKIFNEQRENLLKDRLKNVQRAVWDEPKIEKTEPIPHENERIPQTVAEKKQILMRIAQNTAAKIREKVPDASPNLAAHLYGQMIAEGSAASNFPTAWENKNFAGLHGGASGRKYATYADYENDYAKFYTDGYHKAAAKAKTPEEFARSLKQSGWYASPDVEGYARNTAAGAKEFNFAPSNESKSQNISPKTNETSQDSLAKIADSWVGKTMDNHSVGCVEAATKIGSQYSSFLKDALADGVVNVDVLKNRAKEKGILVKPDETTIQAGDVLVWKSAGRSHVVIADGKNGFYGNSSSADKIIHSDKPHSFGKPDYVIKTGSFEMAAVKNIVEENPSGENTEGEVSQPLFDVTAEDKNVNKIFEDFYNRKKSSGDEENNEFLSSVSDENGKFLNTPENRSAILDRYNDEFHDYFFSFDGDSAKSFTPKTKKTSTVSDENSAFLKNDKLTSALKKVREKAVKNSDIDLATKASEALESNDVARMEKVLKDAGEEISKNDTSNLPKIQKYESISKVQEGKTLAKISADNGIELPETVVRRLENGDEKYIETLRTALQRGGFFDSPKERRVSNENTQTETSKPAKNTYSENKNPDSKPQQTETQEQITPLEQKYRSAEEQRESLRRELERLDDRARETYHRIQEAKKNNDLAKAERESVYHDELTAQAKKIRKVLMRTPAPKGQRALEIASAPVAKNRSELAAQGRALNYVAKENNVKLPEGMGGALEKGYKKAVVEGQKLLQNEGILPSEESVENYESNETKNPAKEKIENNRENSATPKKLENSPVSVSSEETISQSKESGKEKNKLKGLDGKTSKVRLGNKTYADVNYKIVEIEDLVASHGADGSTVDSYPKELQPRNRNKETMIAQMQEIAHNPDV